MVNLKVLRCIKDILIAKYAMFDCDCQNASDVNAQFGIMMRQWRLLVGNGVGDVSFVLYVLFSFFFLAALFRNSDGIYIRFM